MKSQKRYRIRNMNSGNLDSLADFFVKAYGLQTPFRSKRFLKWYFKYPRTGTWSGHASWIAVDCEGNVVSHYGCLSCDMMLNGAEVPVMWGVNAYTLPEWRGLGINSYIVKKLMENNEINGVIGFTEETAGFYKKTGYNVFGFSRLKRHVNILKADSAYEVAEYIGQGRERFRAIFGRRPTNKDGGKKVDIVTLGKNNIMNYEINLDYKDRVTTVRNLSYLKWRYVDNPFVGYGLYAFVNSNTILALVSCRIERLNPLDKLAFRIIDIIGSDEEVRKLVSFTVSKAKDGGCAYMDYSSAGNLYDDILDAAGFASLSDDECDILPQVCSPISQRPNNEYFGLQSRFHSESIKNLSIQDVHFTRADSDRDRLGNMSGPVSRWRSNE